MTRRSSRWFSGGAAMWACVSCLVACNAEVADIGDEASSDGTTEKWVGYVELYQFESGSDRVEVRFANRDETSVSGTVVFGEGPAVIEPYPPLMDDGYSPISGPIEGFEYRMRDPSVVGERVRFKAMPAEHYEDWCAIQTPYIYEDGRYSCVPERENDYCDLPAGCYQIDPVTHETVFVDGVSVSLCELYSVCDCSAQGCAGGVRGTIDFDLRIDGDSAEGSVAGLFGDHRVFLTRE